MKKNVLIFCILVLVVSALMACAAPATTTQAPTTSAPVETSKTLTSVSPATTTGTMSPGDIANAAIGRAMGLILKNIGGIRKGVEDMGIFGNPLKYSTEVAEDEEDSPWEPMHVEHGFKKEDSTVTFFSLISLTTTLVAQIPGVY